jgi:hypothetical protein
MYNQGRSGEIHSPARWNVIGCHMTAPTPVFSSRSIIHQASSHCIPIPARKASARPCWRVPVQQTGCMTSLRVTTTFFPSQPVSFTSYGRPTSFKYKCISLYTISQVFSAVHRICRWKLDRSLTAAYCSKLEISGHVCNMYRRSVLITARQKFNGKYSCSL